MKLEEDEGLRKVAPYYRWLDATPNDPYRAWQGSAEVILSHNFFSFGGTRFNSFMIQACLASAFNFVSYRAVNDVRRISVVLTAGNSKNEF